MGEDGPSPLKKVTQGAGVVFIGTMLELGIAFVGKAVIARFLEVDQYGVISLGILALNATATIGLLGMNKGVARYIPRFEDEAAKRAVLTTAYRLVVVLVVVAAAALFFFAEQVSVLVFDNADLTPVLRIMSVGIPFWALLELGIGVSRGLEIARYRVYTKNILLPTARLAMIAGAVFLGSGMLGIAWAYAAAYATAAIVITYLLRREITLSLSYPKGQPARARELLSYSLPVTVSDFSGYLLRNVDLLLLGALRDVTEVGIYNVAYPLARLMSAIQGAFGFLLMPVISGLQSDGRMDEVQRMYKVVVKWMTFMSVPAFVGMVLFPAPLLSLLFGAKYSSGGTALAVLATGFFIGANLGPSGNALNAVGRTRVTMIMSWLSLGVNLVLNVFLIPRFGFLGAAVATMASILSTNVVGTVMLYRDSGVLPFSRATLQPLCIAGVSVGAVAATLRLSGAASLPALVGVYFLFHAVFAVSVLRFGGIQQEDVKMFREVENRTGVDLEWAKQFLNRFMQ